MLHKKVPLHTRYWLGIFFGTFDMPVYEEELAEFWGSLNNDERHSYGWAMESSWSWWHEQGEFSVRKRFGIEL